MGEGEEGKFAGGRRHRSRRGGKSPRTRSRRGGKSVAAVKKGGKGKGKRSAKRGSRH